MQHSQPVTTELNKPGDFVKLPDCKVFRLLTALRGCCPLLELRVCFRKLLWHFFDSVCLHHSVQENRKWLVLTRGVDGCHLQVP